MYQNLWLSLKNLSACGAVLPLESTVGETNNMVYLRLYLTYQKENELLNTIELIKSMQTLVDCF